MTKISNDHSPLRIQSRSAVSTLATMWRGVFAITFTFIIAVIQISCLGDKTENEIRNISKEFADNYFNFQYANAAQLCTPESEKWLRYVASNITNDDVKIINANQHSTKTKITNARKENDSIWTVVLSVSNAFVIDSIGKVGIIKSDEEYKFEVRMRDGRWLVNLNKVPEPNKPVY